MDKYDKVMELAKRRGFLWNSFELYGGAAGFLITALSVVPLKEKSKIFGANFMF